MTSSGSVALLDSPPMRGAFATFNSTLSLLIYTCISGKKIRPGTWLVFSSIRANYLVNIN